MNQSRVSPLPHNGSDAPRPVTRSHGFPRNQHRTLNCAQPTARLQRAEHDCRRNARRYVEGPTSGGGSDSQTLARYCGESVASSA